MIGGGGRGFLPSLRTCPAARVCGRQGITSSTTRCFTTAATLTLTVPAAERGEARGSYVGPMPIPVTVPAPVPKPPPKPELLLEHLAHDAGHGGAVVALPQFVYLDTTCAQSVCVRVCRLSVTSSASTHTHTHARTRTHSHTVTHTHTRARAHADTHTHNTHTRAREHPHTHTHTHTFKYTHGRRHARTRRNIQEDEDTPPRHSTNTLYRRLAARTNGTTHQHLLHHGAAHAVAAVHLAFLLRLLHVRAHAERRRGTAVVAAGAVRVVGLTRRPESGGRRQGGRRQDAGRRQGEKWRGGAR